MSKLDAERLPRHVAIIPDGNGRWAEARGLARVEGHRRGSDTVQEVIRAAHELGIQELTLYAFSRENWERPPEEVDAVMSLLDRYLRERADELIENGIRLCVIGRLQELSPKLQHEIERLVSLTESNREMRVTLGLAYSGRAEIVDAVRQIGRAVEAGRLDPDAIDEKTLQANLYAPDGTAPDLLIRTGAEHRISNFLLWQLAYTEFFFTDRLWPDFGKSDLVSALLAYQERERRFGRTHAQLRPRP